MLGQRLRIEFVGRAADQRHQHRQQRDARLIDDDAELEVEPCAAALLIDLGIPVLNCGHVEAVASHFLDLPAARFQYGQHLGGKLKPGGQARQSERAGRQRARRGTETMRGERRQAGVRKQL